MTFDRACSLADVPKDEALAVTVGDYDVAIARDGTSSSRSGPVLHAGSALRGRGGRMAPSSAGCTARASSCAPASPPTSRDGAVATFPVEVRGDEQLVDTTTTLN